MRAGGLRRGVLATDTPVVLDPPGYLHVDILPGEGSFEMAVFVRGEAHGTFEPRASGLSLSGALSLGCQRDNPKRPFGVVVAERELRVFEETTQPLSLLLRVAPRTPSEMLP